MCLPDVTSGANRTRRGAEPYSLRRLNKDSVDEPFIVSKLSYPLAEINGELRSKRYEACSRGRRPAAPALSATSFALGQCHNLLLPGTLSIRTNRKMVSANLRTYFPQNQLDRFWQSRQIAKLHPLFKPRIVQADPEPAPLLDPTE